MQKSEAGSFPLVAWIYGRPARGGLPMSRPARIRVSLHQQGVAEFFQLNRAILQGIAIDVDFDH